MEFKEKDIVICSTVEEYNQITDYLHSLGLKWSSGTSYLNSTHGLHAIKSGSKIYIKIKEGVWDVVSDFISNYNQIPLSQLFNQESNYEIY